MSDTISTTDTPVDGLRAWAKGLYPLEAATELLIRGGFAQTWRPWVQPCDDDWPGREGWHWIDFSAIPDQVGAASGGERRFLLFAVSLAEASDVAVALGDLVSGMDRDKVDLMLAAIAHAAGTHEGRPVIHDHDAGTARFGDPYTSLHPWPVTR